MINDMQTKIIVIHNILYYNYKLLIRQCGHHSRVYILYRALLYNIIVDALLIKLHMYTYSTTNP